jgi:hypothetical protein
MGEIQMNKKDKQGQDQQPAVSRRDFIKRSSAGIGLLGLPAAMAACGGSGSDNSTSATSSTAGNSSSATSTALTAAFPTASAWKFGVMADTQWVTVTYGDDGRNPHTCAVDIINQLNTQFIAAGVKFVVQVGDLCDKGTSSTFTLTKSDGTSYASSLLLAEDTRSAFTQKLFNAGIGFFPLRGNHDDSAATAKEFQRIFPQTQNGTHNVTPADVLSLSNPDASVQPVVAKTGSSFTIGSNFNSPSTGLTGLSYAFDVNNLRIVMLDQFEPTNSTNADGNPYTDSTLSSTGYNRTIQTQQSWINTQLAGRTKGTHAIVFSHKGLVTEDHADVLLGDCPAPGSITVNNTNYYGSPKMDDFISGLSSNGVRLLMCGHDHMHDRSKISTIDGSASLTQQVGASNSNKFYYPATTANDVSFSSGKRQTVVSHERNTIGYYIFTVDGDNISIDYYSAPAYPSSPTGGTVTTTPTLGFTWRERFGYGLGGKEFIIAPMASFSSITDTGPGGTVMSILDGKNGNSAIDVAGRSFRLAVNTAWFAATTLTASDVLLLQGMSYTLGSGVTDTYVLSMHYDPAKVSAAQIAAGKFGLASVQNGQWVNTVSANSSGSGSFVQGAWVSGYSLGTWGVNTANSTVWAVIDHNGYFAAVAGI